MKKNHGQGLAEYAILLALIAVGIALILQLYGISVYEAYCSVADRVSGGKACQPDEICGDDFSSDLSGWTTLEGKPGNTLNGAYCPSTYTRVINKCSTDGSLEDYTVSLNGANLTSGWGYGLIFRAENTPDGMNGYVFQYDPGYSPGSFIFRKWVNGRELSVPFAVTKAPNYSWYNAPRDIKVVVDGNTFTAYVDGKAVLTATDSTYTSGGSGIRTWDTTLVCFDEFEMQSNP